MGPDCSAATSGRLYVQTCVSCATFDGVISVSGENRSPASVRLYDGQSPAPPPVPGAGVVAEWPHARSQTDESATTDGMIRTQNLPCVQWTRCRAKATFEPRDFRHA